MEALGKKTGINQQRVLATLQQECNVMVTQLASQIMLIAKVNGILAKELSLVSKHKVELLAVSCDDRWFARFQNNTIEVTLEVEHQNRPVLDKIKLYDIDASGMKFDPADRLWIVNTEGYVEILDIRRSCLQLTPHRMFISKVHEKTTHSKFRLTSIGKDDPVDHRQNRHCSQEFEPKHRHLQLQQRQETAVLQNDEFLVRLE